MSSASDGSAVQKLAELKLELDPEILYNLDSMFPKLTGWGAKGEIKAKHKLIVRIEGLLKRMLRPKEEVLYVAKGVQHKFSEQYFLGVWAALINQTVFVLTNLRLLMLHTDTRGRPRHTFWMIFYNQITKFKSTWTGSIALDLKDGGKFRFAGFKGTDRKQMPAIFQQAVATYRELGFEPSVTQSRENLCGNCLAVVPKDRYQCEQCSQEFWKAGEVGLRSFLLPPWGSLVLGHIGLGIFESLGYTVTWIVFFVWLMSSLGDAAAFTEAVITIAIVLGIEHTIAASLHYFIAKKGLVPKGHPQTVVVIAPIESAEV